MINSCNVTVFDCRKLALLKKSDGSLILGFFLYDHDFKQEYWFDYQNGTFNFHGEDGRESYHFSYDVETQKLVFSENARSYVEASKELQKRFAGYYLKEDGSYTQR